MLITDQRPLPITGFACSKHLSRRLLSFLLLLLAAISSARAGQRHAIAAGLPAHPPSVVGYFPQWGLYSEQPYSVKAIADSGAAALLDQVNYAQGFVKEGHCSVADPNADLDTTYTAANSVSGEADDPKSAFRGYFHQFQQLKQRYPRIKLLISLEGRATDFALDAQPANRKAFVATCIDTFLKGQFGRGLQQAGLFDGIDIDWESPHQEDAENFRELLLEFRRQMDALRPGLLLTIAVGHSPRMLQGVDFKQVAPLVDRVGVMNYDYVGPWTGRSGLIAPLFSSDSSRLNTIDRGMAAYMDAGVPAAKLLMGLPFYGYSWTVPAGDSHGLFQMGRGNRGDWSYRYIQKLPEPYVLYRDPASRAPWLYDGTTFWTYEDPTSVRFKAQYVLEKKLGGVMIWELSGDTADGELLRTVHSALTHNKTSTIRAR